MTKKTHTGIENPALQFISNAETTSREQKQATDQQTKSKRLNLLLRPALLEDLKKIAAMRQTSVNDLINTVLAEFTEHETDQIEKYDSVFGKK